MLEISEVPDLTPDDVSALTDLLVAVVDDGASIGFLPPLDPADAEQYWRSVPGPNTVLLLARENDQLVGTAQLRLEPRPNGLHRAEVAKVIVHPSARRRGIARTLLQEVERAAHRETRTLLILDTREGDPSNDLYRAFGFQEAGRIPHFAHDGNGRFDTTVIYYKRLPSGEALAPERR
ncbi:MAG: GNAT family N-acetyltransferase [Chloroflexi bacterium]|nr:GNAT family N-acetyltransferase [Chloroflexota bacterium]